MTINDDVNVSILDVIQYERSGGSYKTPERSFSALSFRINTETLFTYKGGKVKAERNSITLVPADTEYSSNTTDQKMIVVHFNLQNAVMTGIQTFVPENHEEFYELFQRLLTVWREKKAGYKLEATSIFYKILAEIKKCAKIGDSEDRFTYSAEYMKRHMSDSSLSIHHIAEKLSVSDSLFRRDFKKRFGVSPKEYLDNLRIEYAVTLLQTGYFSQKEIARRCGFSDVKYFRTAFKNKTGICISKYAYEFIE